MDAATIEIVRKDHGKVIIRACGQGTKEELRSKVEEYARHNRLKPTYWYKVFPAQALCHVLG